MYYLLDVYLLSASCEMPKSTIIIVVLLFSGIFEVAELKQSFQTGEKANELLAEDEDKIEDEIRRISNKLSLVEEQLQVMPILKDFAFGLVRKLIDAPKAMTNLLRRYHYQRKLKKAKGKLSIIFEIYCRIIYLPPQSTRKYT